MIRTQPGPHQAILAQGHQQYHNPLGQVSGNHYFSQHQSGPGNGTAGYTETTHVHQVPSGQSSHCPDHLEPSQGKKGRVSESHFVSGPWTSTPPSAGQL
jgi:hypothetical protein